MTSVAARRSLAPVDLSTLWVVPPIALLGALFFYPLALIIGQSLHPSDPGNGLTLANFLRVASTRLFQDALVHTLEISILSTLGCLALGLSIALILAYVPFPGSREIARLIDTFVALPTFLLTLAFTFIYGSAGIVNGVFTEALGFEKPPIDFLYSQWGVILAEITAYTPFVLRPLLASFSQLDVSQIEVASSLGAKPWRVVRTVILPAALPALLAGGSLCLLLTVNEFGIVLFIGAKGVITLPLLVYGKAIQEGDYTAACTIAVINIFLSLILFTLYRVILGRVGDERAHLV
jgi:2-aminoethylphosphonate transport system permease protein